MTEITLKLGHGLSTHYPNEPVHEFAVFNSIRDKLFILGVDGELRKERDLDLLGVNTAI